ncbi:MAG: ATP-binding cassette domain-containing protein [Planctomycetota bacterium]
MTTALLETHELTKTYGSLTALEDCTLEIRAGEIYGLLGPNGSGKTTLIRLLMGYLQPPRGHASIEGLDCYADSVAVHRRVTYLPGEVRLFGHMRGYEVLRFFSEIHPLGDYKRCLAIADRLALDLSRPVAMCSTGMRQKIALVGAIATNTPLVILDEPTANLDPSVRTEVLAILRERAAGRTIPFLVRSQRKPKRSAIESASFAKATSSIPALALNRGGQHPDPAQLNGPVPAAPPELAADLEIHADDSGKVTILTSCELSRLFGWLAMLKISEVMIEPISPQAVQERFQHLPEQGPDA